MSDLRFLQVKTKAGRSIVLNVDSISRVTQVWERCEPNVPGAEQFAEREGGPARWSRPVPEMSKLYFTADGGGPIIIQVPFAHVCDFLNGHGYPH